MWEDYQTRSLQFTIKILRRRRSIKRLDSSYRDHVRWAWVREWMMKIRFWRPLTHRRMNQSETWRERTAKSLSDKVFELSGFSEPFLVVEIQETEVEEYDTFRRRWVFWFSHRRGRSEGAGGRRTIDINPNFLHLLLRLHHLHPHQLQWELLDLALHRMEPVEQFQRSFFGVAVLGARPLQVLSRLSRTGLHRQQIHFWIPWSFGHLITSIHVLDTWFRAIKGQWICCVRCERCEDGVTSTE